MATSADPTQATTPGPGGPPGTRTTPERTIGQLVADASTDVSSIVRSEIELAKIEVTSDVKHAGKGAGMFVGAAVLGLYAFGLILLGAAWGLVALGLPVWAGLLIVAAVLLIVVTVLALLGRSQVSKVQGKPVKTIENAQRTVAAVKPGARSA